MITFHFYECFLESPNIFGTGMLPLKLLLTSHHRCVELLKFVSNPTPSPGHTIVFADQSGMNASGDVMLGTMDVHHQWTKVMQLHCSCCQVLSVLLSVFLTRPLPVYLQLFEQLSSYRRLQQETDWLKERISLLLGGIQVTHLERLGPVQPIAEHYNTLSIFYKDLMSQRLRLHPRSLEGLTMLLEKYALSLLSEGLEHKAHYCVL